jgi:hypothetical protein
MANPGRNGAEAGPRRGLFDRRDFWLAFLCAASGALGWYLGHRGRERALGMASLQRLYDGKTAEAELLAWCAQPRDIGQIAVSEALAANVLSGDPDRVLLSMPLFLAGSDLGPTGIAALRRLLVSEDPVVLRQAIARVRRARPEVVQEVAPDLAALVIAAGHDENFAPVADESAQALCWLGARGCRELLALVTHDTPAVRDLARAALRSNPLGSGETPR